MAKFQTQTITTYTFKDEFSGKEVTQEVEPNTLKIKLTGDATTYEKIMSEENEAKFLEWLKSDGEPLAPARASSTGRSIGDNTYKNAVTAAGYSFIDVKKWAVEDGNQKTAAGTPVTMSAPSVRPEVYKAFADAHDVEYQD